jgi:hypothetical protein
MSLNKAQLTNLVIFMRRVPVTGEEALAWGETFFALNQELAALNAPPASTAVAGTPPIAAPAAPMAVPPSVGPNDAV